VRVFITGIGLETALGNQTEVIWQKLNDNISAIRPWQDLKEQGFRLNHAGRLDSEVDTAKGRKIGLKAAISALESALLEHRDLGIAVGSTMGESAAFELAAEQKTSVDMRTAYPDCFPKHIKKELGLLGPTMTFGTACSAGNYAIGYAADLIRSGSAHTMLAGGVEPFSRIAMTGFARSRAMHKERCRPFQQGTNGMSLGEGAAFVVLESEKQLLARGGKPLAEVGTLGLSCDAYHPTAPNPEGEGIFRAINNALTKQKISSREVDWVCAHGTGTKASDAAEAKALSHLFGEQITVSGYKGAFGHTLGAATAIEAAICALALSKQKIPATTGLETPCPTLAISPLTENLNFLNQHKPNQLDWALNCGYAFGGLNSALLLRSVH